MVEEVIFKHSCLSSSVLMMIQERTGTVGESDGKRAGFLNGR